MSKTENRRRLGELEARVPEEIRLTMDDGTIFEHPGDAMRFFEEGVRGAKRGRGRVLEACRRAVDAKGCGLLWQVIDAIS